MDNLRATGVINVTYGGPLNAFLDEALCATLEPLGYRWSESGFNFETRVRDIRFRLEEDDDRTTDEKIRGLEGHLASTWDYLAGMERCMSCPCEGKKNES